MAHSKGQKDKIRKSGLSLQNKAIKLGQHCNVFSALAYWNPTHKRMETVMHLPRGQALPDMNRLLRRLATDNARSRAGARVTRSSAAAQPVEPEHARVADHALNADHEPVINPDANADSDMDAEYETDPDYNPEAIAVSGPVSAYDEFPDDEDVTVGTDNPRSRQQRLLPQRLVQKRSIQQEQRGHQPTVCQPSNAASSDTINNATQSVPSTEQAPNSRGGRLRSGVGRKHRWPLRRQSVSLASREPTGRQRMAVDGFGCLRPPAAGAELWRGETGLACRSVQTFAASRRPRVRMQREQVAKILSLFDELSTGLENVQFR